MIEQILNQIKESKILQVQIDSSGFCGSQCRFCCVRYLKRPSNEVMSKELFRDVIKQVATLYSDEVPGIWLSSYNDILLDPFLKDRLLTLREHGLSFVVLSNAIGLLKSLELLNEYKDVISGYSFNVPAGNAEDYSLFTFNPEKTFYLIIDGLLGLYNLDPEKYNREVSITVNGSFSDEYGRAQLKYSPPDGDTEKQVGQLKNLLPYEKISDARPLCDRAGNLKEFAIDNSVMPIREWWKLPIGAEVASGCNGGSRLLEWVHVTNSGNLITCCQDFQEIFSWGSLKNDRLVNLLYSKQRAKAIEDTLRDLCTKCWFSY